MNPDRPPRGSRDWSWEPEIDIGRVETHWPCLPYLGGVPRLVPGLVQDRLHQQNSTWTNGPTSLSSSFYSLNDLENSAELDPSVNRPGHWERVSVPIHAPSDPESRGHHPRPAASPRPVVRQGSASRPSRPTRRGDWWSYPSVPLHSSVYDRPPQYTSTTRGEARTPVSGATGLSVITRAPPTVRSSSSWLCRRRGTRSRKSDQPRSSRSRGHRSTPRY